MSALAPRRGLSYVYGPGGLPIEQINSEEEPTYLHHDQQGSTRLLTSSTGAVTGAYTYTPYGATESHTGTATTPLGYDAQYTSSDTGLIYLRARVYDPATAQFMSVDPLKAWSQAPYDYASDNTLNRYDPSGLLSFGEIVGGVEEGANTVGNGLNEAGKEIASAGKYAAPAVDILAGGTCVVVTEGACALVIAGNVLAQQALVADQAAYNLNYDWAANEAAIVAGAGLGLSGLGAVANSELGAFGRAALGAAVSAPAWILDLVQGLSPEAASAALLTCR